MLMFLWVTLKGEEFDGARWVARRILRLKGRFVTLNSAIDSVVSIAIREAEMHGICFNDKFHIEVKLTLDCPKSRAVFVCSYPYAEFTDEHLIWESILPDVLKEGKANE